MAAASVALLLSCFLAAGGGFGFRPRGGASLDDDLLLPYPRARPREPRDCRPVRNGSRPHETWPPGPPDSAAHGLVVHSFVSYFPAVENGWKRAVSGHLTVATAPLRSFSVLEPGGPGGCAAGRRRPVEDTARAAGCLVAQNGGFFRMETGECLGNLVSDGRRVGDAGGLQNAQFGIRRDGTLVTGYLTEEEVLDEENPFVQLVSGVVWLLRAGRSYVNESQELECDKTQETGTFSKFVNVVSARTALGHDKEGRLVLFHADGQTDRRGINLWEMAEFLKEQGVVNAINLDGGGSATFVVNGTLASYPSDHWSVGMNGRPYDFSGWPPVAGPKIPHAHPRRCRPFAPQGYRGPGGDGAHRQTQVHPAPRFLTGAERTACGAAPALSPPWCACTSPAASHPTAAAMGTASRAPATAPGPSGAAPAATCWTVAPPTAACTGCAVTLAVSVTQVGWAVTAAKPASLASSGMAAPSSVGVRMEPRATPCMGPVPAPLASTETSAPRHVPWAGMVPTASSSVSVRTRVPVIQRPAAATLLSLPLSTRCFQELVSVWLPP